MNLVTFEPVAGTGSAGAYWWQGQALEYPACPDTSKLIINQFASAFKLEADDQGTSSICLDAIKEIDADITIHYTGFDPATSEPDELFTSDQLFLLADKDCTTYTDGTLDSWKCWSKQAAKAMYTSNFPAYPGQMSIEYILTANHAQYIGVSMSLHFKHFTENQEIAQELQGNSIKYNIICDPSCPTAGCGASDERAGDSSTTPYVS
jgi:hypothetical protein